MHQTRGHYRSAAASATVLLRSLTAAALLLATALPAQASIHHDILRKLRQLGVTVTVKPNCQRPMEGRYIYGRGRLEVCDHLTDAQARRVLTHEAVHVIQDCWYGSIGDGHTRPIGYSIAADVGTQEAKDFFFSIIRPRLRPHVNHINASASNAHRHFEIEAYALQDEPEIVYRFLTVC